MKVLIAMDSFKGSLSASEACDAVEAGIKEINKTIECIKRPIADGGEGTVNTLVDALNGERVFLTVKDPLMRDIEAYYGIINTNTAIVEMAISSGLTLLSKEERNPLLTSTYGVGQMIKDGIDKGIREFIVGIGGSATNDAGIGMLNALGINFYDQNDKLLEPIGESLKYIYKIDYKDFDIRINDCRFLIATDVNNPLFGLNGAAYVYGPQKGASNLMVKELDEVLRNFHKIVNKTFNEDYSNLPGTGAAGGLGYAFKAFLKADLKSGIDIIIEKLGFEELVKSADLIITGEGKIDIQSKMGKVLSGLGKLGIKHKKPVIAFAGSVDQDIDLKDIGIYSIYKIDRGLMPFSKSMETNNAKKLLKETVLKSMLKSK